MTLDPLLSAPAIIQFHVAAALIGIVIGPFALFRNRRDRVHKTLGYIWVVSIAAVSLSALWIGSEIAILWHFGPIHLLSLFTLWGVGEGIWHIRRGNIAAHRASMQSVWFGAMGLAGLFTFAPGRIMNQVVFGGPNQAGWAIIGLGIAVLGVTWRAWIKRSLPLA